MDDSADDRVADASVTRRRLFRLSALATTLAGTTAWAGCARAQQPKTMGKASKQVAGYIEKTENSAQTCVLCHFFIDPDDCIIVEGPVSPWGYCNYFAD